MFSFVCVSWHLIAIAHSNVHGEKICSWKIDRSSIFNFTPELLTLLFAWGVFSNLKWVLSLFFLHTGVSGIQEYCASWSCSTKHSHRLWLNFEARWLWPIKGYERQWSLPHGRLKRSPPREMDGSGVNHRQRVYCDVRCVSKGESCSFIGWHDHCSVYTLIQVGFWSGAVGDIHLCCLPISPPNKQRGDSECKGRREDVNPRQLSQWSVSYTTNVPTTYMYI